MVVGFLGLLFGLSFLVFLDFRGGILFVVLLMPVALRWACWLLRCSGFAASLD